LKSEIIFYQQACVFSTQDFVNHSKEDIEDLNQTRADLEQACYELRSERDLLVSELDRVSKDIDKAFTSQKAPDLHWERLQHAYQQQLDSMQKDISNTKSNYSKLIKGRDDIISDMILLNTKNAELSQLNNDLSRKVMEREQEAKALFAGTNFLTSPEEAPPQTSQHRRNPSGGSVTEAKLAQRDSFNGSAAPKMFKFRRNKSNSLKRKEDKLISVPYESNTKSQEPESVETNTNRGGKHHFVQTKFIMAVKCEGCSEKMRRVNELKCSGNINNRISTGIF
jgi:chromosome segregation ATPase